MLKEPEGGVHESGGRGLQKNGTPKAGEGILCSTKARGKVGEPSLIKGLLGL